MNIGWVNKVAVATMAAGLCAGAGAQVVAEQKPAAAASVASRAAVTTGSRTLARIESDAIDPEQQVLTVDRITSSGTRILWTYSPTEGERKY